MNNFYIIPNNKDILLNNLILPLEDYSIGFDVYYKVEEINKLSEKYNISVIINKFMHKADIENIGGILNKLINIKYFFIEDLGLTYFIPKEKVVISQNHIINNYDSINYFKELGFTSVLINNDLTIEEIKEIISNTSSNLFMYFISKNNLMYSKRHLISAFSDYKNNVLDNKKEISEKVSNYKLLIKEEECGTCIFNSKIFSANKYLDDIACINKIINLSNINEEKTKVILNNYNDKDLDKLLGVDNYFLENKIAYKVGDLND